MRFKTFKHYNFVDKTSPHFWDLAGFGENSVSKRYLRTFLCAFKEGSRGNERVRRALFDRDEVNELLDPAK